MPEQVLFVDDEPAILDTFGRLLRYDTLKRTRPDLPEFSVATAPGGAAGLALLADRGPFAVVVSDLRMPGMDGIAFLERARTIAPASVRIMLTGQADITTAIDAVNRGAIFRFLTKPCPRDVLVPAILDALRQYQLVTAERQLLDQTLAGSVKILTEVLSLVNPIASSRALRVRRYVQHLVERLKLPDAWQLELAAMLSQIGHLTLNVGQETEVRDAGETGASKDRAHAAAARDLLSNIPRLEAVAEIVGRQLEPVDPSEIGEPLGRWNAVRRAGQVLCVALEFDSRISSGMSVDTAMSRLRMRPRQFEPTIVDALSDIDLPNASTSSKRVSVHDLQTGMLLDEDVRTSTGMLLVRRGTDLTLPLLIRLRNLAGSGAIDGRLQVLAPDAGR